MYHVEGLVAFSKMHGAPTYLLKQPKFGALTTPNGWWGYGATGNFSGC